MNGFHYKEIIHFLWIIHLNLTVISFFFLAQNGYWADYVCEKKAGYICKRKPISQVTGEKEITDAGCKKVSI